MSEQKEDPAPASPAAPEAPAQAPSAPEPALATAIGYLEAGKADRAREMLEVLLGKAPNSKLLASLLRQIDAPVEQLVPAPYRPVEVNAGESLSLIAARELGDPLRFYALARLNNIDVPARLSAGTVLQVPDLPRIEDVEVQAEEAPADISASEIESVAEYLAGSGQGEQARRMLVGRVRSHDAPESTRLMLIQMTLARATQLRAAAEFDRAIAVVDEAISAMNKAAPPPELVEARALAQAEMLVRAAESLRARRDDRNGTRDELLQAHEMAEQAVKLDPSSARAATLVDETRSDLIAALHNKALVAWRDRDVDQAIRAWESLLEAVPDFEPARVYLERARRLRERLEQPQQAQP